MIKMKLKHIVIVVIAIIAAITILQFYTGHRANFRTESKKYLFLFKDSVIKNIDSLSTSSVSDYDVLSDFIYHNGENKYYVTIWEFKDLKNYSLEDVFIEKKSVLGESEFRLQETLNTNGPCPISLKFLYKIDGLTLNLDENSRVIKEFNSKEYKGFYALIDRMSICDKKGLPQIYFNFAQSQTPTILLLSKIHGRFFFIMINSKNEFDEKIIDILNLNQ